MPIAKNATSAIVAVCGAAIAWAAIAVPVVHASSVVTIRQGDLISQLSDTRSAGHVTFLADGLHVWTDDTTSQAKAAEYFAVTGGLPASASLEWFGTQPQPGQQIVFDADGTIDNGNDYNILVGEPVYGGNWWLTNGSSADAKAADPSGANDGGNGSPWFGTLAEWAAALPGARMYAGGFSLGSGVKGDGVIGSITYDDTVFRFTSNPVLTPVAVKGSSSVDIRSHRVIIDFRSQAQPANTVLGQRLVWKVRVDGETIAVIRQGFADHDTVIYRFGSGRHHVKVLKNGVIVRDFIVRG